MGDTCVTPGGCRSDDNKAFCCAGTACGDHCCGEGYECQTNGRSKQCVLKCAARVRFLLLILERFLTRQSLAYAEASIASSLP
jgi:hypothetical protein